MGEMGMTIRHMMCKRKAKRDVHKLFWNTVNVATRFDPSDKSHWGHRSQILFKCSEIVADKYKIKSSKVRSWFYGYECPDHVTVIFDESMPDLGIRKVPR